MHRPILLRAALLIVLLAVSAGAADVSVDDLRLEYSPLLGRTYHIWGPIDDDAAGAGVSLHGTISSTQTVSSHRRYGLGYYRSLSPLEADHGSFVLGLAGSYDRIETLGGSVGRSLIADGFAGFAWAFTPAWQVEEGVLLGVGRTTWDAHFPGWYFDGADWNTVTHAITYEYGLRLGTSYTYEHVQASIDVRYLVANLRLNLSGQHTNGSTSENVSWRAHVRTEGLGGVATVGWRF